MFSLPTLRSPGIVCCCRPPIGWSGTGLDSDWLSSITWWGRWWLDQFFVPPADWRIMFTIELTQHMRRLIPSQSSSPQALGSVSSHTGYTEQSRETHLDEVRCAGLSGFPTAMEFSNFRLYSGKNKNRNKNLTFLIFGEKRMFPIFHKYYITILWSTCEKCYNWWDS